jgi:hypothetical protein
MAWQDEPTIILREIIGDDGTTYTDAKLRRLLAVSMYRVRSEVSLDVAYTVDLTAGAEAVTPSPEVAPKDYDAINMMALRAAIVILSADLKIAASESITIKDGPSTISTVDRGKYLSVRLEWAQKEYDDYIKNYVCGSSRHAGAVSTPFTRYGSSGSYDTSRSGDY